MNTRSWCLFGAMVLGLVHLSASFSFKAQVGNRYAVKAARRGAGRPAGRRGWTRPTGTFRRRFPLVRCCGADAAVAGRLRSPEPCKQPSSILADGSSSCRCTQQQAGRGSGRVVEPGDPGPGDGDGGDRSHRAWRPKASPQRVSCGLHGGAAGRTADLLNAIQALYQLSWVAPEVSGSPGRLPRPEEARNPV